MGELNPSEQFPFTRQYRTRFANAIKNIVNEFTSGPNPRASVSQLCAKYHIKRRRLYDVVTIFTAIGYSKKNGTDEIVWQGDAESLQHLRQESRTAEINNQEKSLSELFPKDNCPGLAATTIPLILLFAAMKVEVIDLREASWWFSRNTGMCKSTLCKLYQIALILRAFRLIEKNANVCEVKIQSTLPELLN
jgi:hypothetical protein